MGTTARPILISPGAYYYDPYQDPYSPEYQAQQAEEWYYYQQQNPDELFFNDPMQLWNQDPFMYEMYQDIYNDPMPGLPDLYPGFP